MKYVRKVSALERYSLVLHKLYKYHVDGILEGRGEVSAPKLQAAVNQAAEKNPAIRVRLRGVLAFSKWVDSGIAPQVRTLPLSPWDGRSEENAPFLQDPLPVLKGGPIADVLIVPCTDGMTRLVFRTAHAALDGRGFMHWVQEVCKAMRGDELAGSWSTLTDLDVQAQHAADLLPEEPVAPVNCLPVVEPSAAPYQPLAYIWRRVELPGNQGQLLTKAAAFFAESIHAREQGDVGFTIPVDYRGLRTEETGMGNLTGYMRLTVPQGSTPRALMKQLLQKIQAKVDCRTFPNIKTLLWIPVWYMLRGLKPKVDAILYTRTPALPTGGLVSMGLIKPEEYSFPGFEVRTFYGIPGAVGKLNMVFVNHPDSTVVSFAAPRQYNLDGQLDQLLGQFARQFSDNKGLNLE